VIVQAAARVEHRERRAQERHAPFAREVQRRLRPKNRRARYKTASLTVSLNLALDEL